MYVSRMKKMTKLLISLMREEKLYSIFQKFILHYILSCEGVGKFNINVAPFSAELKR